MWACSLGLVGLGFTVRGIRLRLVLGIGLVLGLAHFTFRHTRSPQKAASPPEASILRGFRRAISHIFENGGVDRLVISTDLLRLDRQIVARKVKCALLCQMWWG